MMQKFLAFLFAFIVGCPTDIAVGYVINGELERAKLENKTTDPSSPGEGRIFWDSDDNLFRFYTGAAWRTVADTTTAIVNPMDSAGDMLYGGAAGAATKLDSGTSGQILISGGAATPVWTTLLPIANGGTNKALTLAAGGLAWTDADSFEVGAAGTGSDWALSGGTGAPTFSSTTTTAKTFSATTDASSSTTGTVIVSGGVGIAKKLYVGTSLNFSDYTKGIAGTATNDAAGAGFVGESFLQTRLSAAAVSMNTTVVYDVTASSITLTAGDWDISGAVQFTHAASTVTRLQWGISTASATLPSSANAISTPDGTDIRMIDDHPIVALTGNTVYAIPTYRVSLSGSDTIFLVASGTFSSGNGTVAVNGYYTARRAR